MLADWIINITFTHILLMVLIVLVSTLILFIRVLITLFYEDFLMESRVNILSKIYRELLNIGGAMNLIKDATQNSDSNIVDVAIILGYIQDDLNKLTPKIDPDLYG